MGIIWLTGHSLKKKKLHEGMGRQSPQPLYFQKYSTNWRKTWYVK